MGELSISATPDSLKLWILKLHRKLQRERVGCFTAFTVLQVENTLSAASLRSYPGPEIMTKWCQMEQHFELIGIVKS